MASHLIVGDEGATFNEILVIIDRSHSAPLLMNDWRRLARALGLPHFEIRKMNENLIRNTETPIDVLHSILIEWRSRTASEATVERLCEILRSIGMNAISDELWHHFLPKLSTHDPTDISVAIKPEDELVFDVVAVAAAVVGSYFSSRLTGNTNRKDATTPIASEDKSTNQNIQDVAFMTVKVGETDIYYYPAKTRLGQGATSLVYQGYFGKVHTLAAIKQIKMKDSEFFKKELDAFKMLSTGEMEHHPNIVKLFKSTEDHENLYFAMEQATCDLRKFLELSEDLDRKTMLGVLFDMVNGLKFLHHKSILHRDIKPENILMFENNEVWLAKLGDFGTCRKMTSVTSTLSMTKGTEVWMSPEAIVAMHKETPFPNSRSLDIFCLGMTMYFIFSNGKHPFAKSEKYDCFPVMNIKDPEVQYIRLETWDSHTAQLLDWMMKKTPKDRPDINQVARELIWLK